MPLFVALNGTGHLPGLVGGKAAALDKLVASGFRVPPSAALTSEAYKRFVRATGLSEWLVRFGRRRPTTGGAEAERREVQEAFLEAPLPDDVRAAVEAAWAAVSDGHQVAVRSSATAEDMVASSFAGQYLSVLEVDDLNEVELAVKRVWASLWEAGARAYRRRMRIDNRRLAMGVVIQRMVPALRSGVCFTLDPTTEGALRIEVVDGLGEQLVSGSTTPTVHQLKMPSLRTLEGEAPDPELRKIARTSLLIQEEMGNRPQDVEWSIADDGLWVLQARPITTLGTRLRAQPGDGFDTRKIPGALYSPTGVGEMLPGVLPPLMWTINGPMVEEGFRKLFARLQALPDPLDEAYSILARIDGQAALNITAIKNSAAKLSGGTGSEIERQYLGRAVSEGSEDGKKPGLVGRTASSLRAMKLQKRIEAEAESFERSVAAVRSLPRNFSEMLTTELVAYRARVRDLAASGVATQVAVATVAVTTYAALESMLDRWTGAGAEWAQKVTRGGAISHDPVTTAATRVWERFKDLPNSKAIVEAISDGEPGTIEHRLAASCAEGADFACQLRAELESLGSSAVYGGPLWTEQRGYVWSIVMRWLAEPQIDHEDQDTVEEQARRDLEELTKTFMGSWGWRAKRILTGQVVDIRKRLLREMIADTQRLLRRRETLKSALLALGGIERRVILELGARSVRRGLLDSAKDVQLLADWELDDVVLGRAGVNTEVMQSRREALMSYQAGPVLKPLVSDELQEIRVATTGVKGWAASPGKHRGRVRVVRDPSDAGDLRHGDVLVASATDPSWTPLFMIAGAIVVERGGPLSHAAIVSRELGVPAVLNAAGATETLHDGALVEVDGSAGTVSLVDEVVDETVNAL
jgi:pyruvate,water dikinase